MKFLLRRRGRRRGCRRGRRRGCWCGRRRGCWCGGGRGCWCGRRRGRRGRAKPGATLPRVAGAREDLVCRRDARPAEHDQRENVREGSPMHPGGKRAEQSEDGRRAYRAEEEGQLQATGLVVRPQEQGGGQRDGQADPEPGEHDMPGLGYWGAGHRSSRWRHRSAARHGWWGTPLLGDRLVDVRQLLVPVSRLKIIGRDQRAAGPPQGAGPARRVAVDAALAYRAARRAECEAACCSGQNFRRRDAQSRSLTRGSPPAAKISWPAGRRRHELGSARVNGVGRCRISEEGIAAALASTAVCVLCQYDREGFDPVTLATASALHPLGRGRDLLRRRRAADLPAVRATGHPAGRGDRLPARRAARRRADRAIRFDGGIMINMTAWPSSTARVPGSSSTPPAAWPRPGPWCCTASPGSRPRSCCWAPATWPASGW